MASSWLYLQGYRVADQFQLSRQSFADQLEVIYEHDATHTHICKMYERDFPHISLHCVLLKQNLSTMYNSDRLGC